VAVFSPVAAPMQTSGFGRRRPSKRFNKLEPVEHRRTEMNAPTDFSHRLTFMKSRIANRKSQIAGVEQRKGKSAWSRMSEQRATALAGTFNR